MSIISIFCSPYGFLWILIKPCFRIKLDFVSAEIWICIISLGYLVNLVMVCKEKIDEYVCRPVVKASFWHAIVIYYCHCLGALTFIMLNIFMLIILIFLSCNFIILQLLTCHYFIKGIHKCVENLSLQGNIRYLEEYAGEWKLSRDLAVFKLITPIGMPIELLLFLAVYMMNCIEQIGSRHKRQFQLVCKAWRSNKTLCKP